MITRHAKYISLAEKICIGVFLAWGIGMLVLLWLSGTRETAEAVKSGKRFVIHVTDGRVEGAAMPTGTEEAKKEGDAPIPPPVAEPTVTEMEEVPTVKQSNTPIAEVSDELLDKTSGVSLPRVSASGNKPWQYYAKNFRRPNESPMVAIIITGLGQSRHVTEMAMAMDEPVGLSFSPYAASVMSWAAASRISGHEMYVDLPFQTVGYPADDPGPYSILLSRSNTENSKSLYWALSRFQGYVGLVTPPGEVVVNNADTFKTVREDIANRGLLLLMGHDTALQDSGKETLVGMQADIWIDEELTDISIQARLAMLEQIAQRNGSAIGIAQAYPLSISQIRQWQGTLESHGLTLAPLSFIAKLKYH